MSDISQAYNDLCETGYKLYYKFLYNYVHTRSGQLSVPDEFEFEVKSFCVLFHASLEAFIEGVAFHIFKDAKNKLENEGCITKSLFSLFMYTPSFCHEIKKGETSFETVVNRARTILGERGESYINELLDNNHGAGKWYLKNILMRLGVDISPNWEELQALDKLVDARGEYAHWDINHRRRKARPKVVSPDDAEEYFLDCLRLARKIVANYCSDVKDFHPAYTGLLNVLVVYKRKIIQSS